MILDTLEVLEGALPRRTLALVRERARIHKEELRRAWERAKAHEPLRDPALFAQVTVDEHGAPTWPDGADLAPDAIYRQLSESTAS